MTRPGPDIIYACPRCKTLVRQYSYASMLIPNVTVWTDGLVQIPGISFPNQYHLCQSCGTPFWLTRKREVKRPSSAPEHSVITGSAENHRAALAGGLARNRAEKIALRKLILQADNDPYRFGPKANEPTGERKENLEALKALTRFPHSLELQVFRGEVLRELGESDKAVRVLAAPARVYELRAKPDGSPNWLGDNSRWPHYRLAADIHKLARHGDAQVRIVSGRPPIPTCPDGPPTPAPERVVGAETGESCSTCGMPLQSGQRFCNACGNPVWKLDDPPATEA